jgi:hypothetical protein
MVVLHHDQSLKEEPGSIRRTGFISRKSQKKLHMKNSKTEPVEVVLSFNPNSSEKNSLSAKIVTVDGLDNLKKLDDNHKLVRRYSFDDNGGGYRGL